MTYLERPTVITNEKVFKKKKEEEEEDKKKRRRNNKYVFVSKLTNINNY